MGDSFHNHVPSPTSSEPSSSKLTLVASCSKSLSHKSLKQIPIFNNGKIRKSPVNDVALFLLKVGALETVRRLSKHRCPFIWSSLQTLQVFCYPPLKWLQRWNLFRNLIKGMQMLSRPLLVLSIATTFSNHSEHDNLDSDDIEVEDSDGSDYHGVQESHPELPLTQSTRVDDEVPSHSIQSSTNWLIDLYKELDNQGLHLPERINEDELYRFHYAANGDFSSLLTSVKKSIQWRKTYKILHKKNSRHGQIWYFGMELMLKTAPVSSFVSLLASTCHPVKDPDFHKQSVEYGILHLVNAENPEVTVLVDCEGLSLRFPMQLLRSCSVTLQENYPDRLGCLFIIRLPPVARVIAQTFIQVLKPATRQKLKIIGRMYKNALAEYLQTFPSYLGGECGCCRCVKVGNSHLEINEFNEEGLNVERVRSEGGFENYYYEFGDVNEGCERVLRSAVVGILMVWVLIALIAGILDPETRPGLQI